jgi:hypothetical protein
VHVPASNEVKSDSLPESKLASLLSGKFVTFDLVESGSNFEEKLIERNKEDLL